MIGRRSRPRIVGQILQLDPVAPGQPVPRGHGDQERLVEQLDARASGVVGGRQRHVLEADADVQATVGHPFGELHGRALLHVDPGVGGDALQPGDRLRHQRGQRAGERTEPQV